jgi:15-cis-phytoene synthase
MKSSPRLLEEPYRSRAVPAGTVRYWSWLFAAPECRGALLGVYALIAEWRALMDAATEQNAAQLKLGWWQEEIRRLARHAPVHPIGRYLCALPRAGAVDFEPLDAAIEAVARQIAGAPMERGAELEAHSGALWANPLMVAARLARDQAAETESAVRRAASALAAADYLSDALAGYQRDALRGRVVFPVDELLAARIEDADLCAAEAPAHLQAYLDGLRRRAAQLYAASAGALPREERAPLRHLLVLAELGMKHLNSRRVAGERSGLKDLYVAWSTARRAARRAGH